MENVKLSDNNELLNKFCECIRVLTNKGISRADPNESEYRGDYEYLTKTLLAFLNRESPQFAIGSTSGDPYKLSNEKLLEKFSWACDEWIKSRIGCTDPREEQKRSEFNFVRFVVLSRLDGKLPPFSAGDRVVYKNEGNWAGLHLGGIIYEVDKIYTISRVFYAENDIWFLLFEEINYKQGGPKGAAESKYFKKTNK